MVVINERARALPAPRGGHKDRDRQLAYSSDMAK